MGKISVYIHKSAQDAVDLIATVVDTSRSEIVENCIRYVLDNELENKVWDDYDDKLEEFEDKLEALGEEALEEEEDEPEEDLEEED